MPDGGATRKRPRAGEAAAAEGSKRPRPSRPAPAATKQQSGRKRQTKVRAIAAGSQSRGTARKATAEFHALLHQEEELLKAGAEAASSQALSAVRAKIQAMGGRRAYQDASRLNTREFRSSRLVTSTLSRLGLRPSSGQGRLKVLEIGAINPDLQRCRWMETRAIDVLATAPGVEERDFFTLVPPALAAGRTSGSAVGVPSASAAGIAADGPFDVVVCSMVLNCVTQPAARGRMLAMCRDILRCHDEPATGPPGGAGSAPARGAVAGPAGADPPSPRKPDSPEPPREEAGRRLSVVGPEAGAAPAGSGHLFVMLPRRCVELSPHSTAEVFEAACRACGLDLVGKRLSPGIVCWCFRAAARLPRLGLAWSPAPAGLAAPVGAEAPDAEAATAAASERFPRAPEGVPGPWADPPVTGNVAAVSVLPSPSEDANDSFASVVDAQLSDPTRLVRRIAKAKRSSATSFAVCFRRA